MFKNFSEKDPYVFCFLNTSQESIIILKIRNGFCEIILNDKIIFKSLYGGSIDKFIDKLKDKEGNIILDIANIRHSGYGIFQDIRIREESNFDITINPKEEK